MRLSESEWQVMNTLWEQHPATTREVCERLPEEINWAYTTVKTMLTRLVKKGAVTEQKKANTSHYEPLVSRDRARRTAISRLMDLAFGGAVAPMLSFLAEEKRLSENERRELIDILEKETDE